MPSYTSNILISKRKKNLSKENLHSKSVFLKYWEKYCKNTQMHGIRYLSRETSPLIERHIWFVFVVLGILSTIYMYVMLSKRYKEQLLQTVVENSQLPVHEIQFPSIAICAKKRINWAKYREAEQLFIPENKVEQLRRPFKEFLSFFQYFRFENISEVAGIENVDLRALDFLNITALAEFLSFRCDEIMTKCMWRKQEYPCCSLFVLRRTEVGYCLVFNSLATPDDRVKKDAYYPYRESGSGEGSGLKIVLALNKNASNVANNSLKQGLFVMIKRPEEWSTTLFQVISDSDNSFLIRPKLTNTDSDVKALSPSLRNCIFDDEKDYEFYKGIVGIEYRQQNCMTQCHQEYLLEKCKCRLPLFFPKRLSPSDKIPDFPDCKPSDFKCLLENKEFFSHHRQVDEERYVKKAKNGMYCPCLPSCFSIDYAVYVSHFPHWYDDEKDISKINISIHYESTTAVQYRTKFELSFTDLIANFGGVLGLFMGGSIMSGLEILYYIVCAIIDYTKERHRNRKYLNTNKKY